MLGVADRPTDVADVAFIGGALPSRRVNRWRAGPEGGRTADHLVNGGRCALRGTRVRLAALRTSEVRPHPVFDRLVHELCRAQHIHCHRRYFRWPGLRQRIANPGHRPDDSCGAHLRPFNCHSSWVCLLQYLSFPRRIVLGVVSGARTTTPCSAWFVTGPKSQIPALGYTVICSRQYVSHNLGHGLNHAADITITERTAR